MNLKPNEEEALKKLSSVLKKHFASIDLWLFGSKAGKAASPESDVDVMIVVEENTPQIQSFIDDVVFELNLDYDCLISCVLFGRDELETGPMSESPLYRTVLEEGLRV